MEPLKRIIYCIKLIYNDGDCNPIYDVGYHYIVQVINSNERVDLNDSIYECVTYHPTTVRFLEVYAIDIIYPEDEDYAQYLYLSHEAKLHLFYSKQMKTFKLSNVC